MFCKNCGTELEDNAVVCPHCGVQVGIVNDPNVQGGAPYGNGQPYNGQPYGQPYNGQPYGQPYNGQPYNGQPYQPYGNQNYAPNQSNENKNNKLAIVGFVLSFLVAIAGLICSILGFRKAKNEGYNHKKLALAGIIIAVINMVLGAILYSILDYEIFMELMNYMASV